MKKITGLFIVLLLFAIHSYGQWLKPTLSVNTNVTFPQNENQIVSGIFDINTRLINVGFEITNEFNLRKSLFITTGFRYTPITTTVLGLNQLDSIHKRPEPFIWTRKFGIVTIPILLTKHFSTHTNRNHSYFVGFSPGIFMSNYAMDRVRGGAPTNIKFMDTVSYQITGTGNLEKTQLYGTVDLGMKYQPFKKWQNLELGLLANYQLNKNRIGIFQATATNETKNQTFTYHTVAYQKFANISISIGYKFGNRN